jgi:hypothetical protein
MPNEVHNARLVLETREGVEANERWDVGLGERLAQTIWKWLGREGEGEKAAPRKEPRYRRAA